MSGKAYTMKEMKTIVEYLTEHKAYNEIKGRKMWKDLADSKITNRTWQSLKETFLKRILPDIQNPYYKLSLLQISSFKQGHDVETRLNNKLEIHSAGQDSNTESEGKKKDEADDDKDQNENAVAGEELKQSESDLRASTETLVLENVEENDQSRKKSLRELITYSEPLTPMAQAGIDDFVSDDGEGSNDEPRMQIVELSETEANNEDEGKDTNDKTVENATPKEPQKQNKSTVELPDTSANKSSPKKSEAKEPQLNNKEPANVDSCNGKNDNISIILSDTDEVPQNKKDEISKENLAVREPKTSTEMTQNSNTTTDTLLPDNQEGFKGNTQSISDNSKEVVKETQNKKRGTKRANSQENQSSAILKKKYHKEKQSISDTDTLINSNKNISTKSSLITIKENISEATVEPLVKKNRKIVDVIDNRAPEKDQEDTTGKNIENNEKKSEKIENPCLKSVSLYEEQFSNSKYTDSETSHKEENKNNEKQNKDENEQPSKEAKTKTSKEKTANQQIIPHKTTVNTAKTTASNEVLILKSHSDSHSGSDKERTKKLPGQAMKQHREKVLADVFGFSSGVRRRRKSGNKYRKPTSSRNPTLTISSDSSEWTSDTDSEYISPPRGRRNRQTRKYLKPKSARILSLEEDGGLFVIYGKTIIPMIKDGKIKKNYVTYSPDNDPDESFWKLKYVEEKKRTAELAKLLKQVQEKSNDDEVDIENEIPVLPTTSKNQRDERPKKSLEQVMDREKMPVNKDAGDNKSAQEEKTVKIKFTKNNEEVQYEGHWSHVNPVLAQVMQLFQKEPELKPNELKSIQSPEPRNICREPTTVALVVDEEVHAKVNKIESEIFKEIEEREKEKSPTPKEEVPPIEDNVTKRRGRPRKSQLNTEEIPAKKAKVDETEHKLDEMESANQLLNTPVTKRSTRTPKKSETDNTETKDTKVVKTRQDTKSLTPKESEDDVRYMLPSPQTRKSTTKKTNKVTKNTRQRKSSSLVNIKACYSPGNLSLHSVESTQGYIDSDESPIRRCTRRKKRKNLTLPSYRNKIQTWLRKRRSHPYLTDDITSESNSFQGPPLKSMTFDNSTLKSDVYKSESYQLLMNQNVTLRNKSSRLERIEEADNLSMDLNVNDQICEDIIDVQIEKDLQKKDNLNSDSSSVITLPTSPVLSIVENISISKSMLSHSNDFALEEEMPRNEVNGQTILNELITVDGDVSMPLMEQECDIVSSAQNGVEYHYNLNVPKTTVLESLVNNMNVVNIEDPTLSESIQSKLKDLILDSAKKNNQSNSNSLMNKDKKDIQNEEKLGDKITKQKSRSSTPRKRQSTRKLKLVTNEACIEEEHMESCSQTSRKSCPPMIQVFENFNLDTEMNNSIEISEPNFNKFKGRKKKNIIKVKITKPKAKKLNKVPVEKGIENVHMSNQTDSGINVAESSVFFNTFNNSVDLTHNHSETCLNANECLGDSVEVIQNSAQSIISIDSNSNKSQENISHYSFDSLTEKFAHELFSNNAQDVSILQKAIGVSEYKTAESAAATIYHTPIGSLSPPESLMTEDLSDEIREKTTPNATKWYLLSEDETTNTNLIDINQNAIASSGYGANLNEIFPITCAVPNLSTVTEMSKENDENTKNFNDDTNTRNDLDSQSLFN